MRQFHSFLFTDAPGRASYIRALKVETTKRPEICGILDQPGDASLLIDILTSCPRLQHLSVILEVDDISHSPGLIDDPQIVDAIAGIQSLRSLYLRGWDTDAYTLLRSTHQPLRTLGLHTYNIQTEREVTDFWFPAKLEDVLPRFLPNLEKLELSKLMVDSEEIQGVLWIPSALPSVFSMTQYPAVHSLSVTYFMREPLLDHLQHLFPALDGTLSLGVLDSWMEEDSYSDIRVANQRAQQTAVSRAWKQLDRVVCDGRMLYVLGLSCPIRLVMLDYPSVYRESRPYAAEALRENPVPRLKMTLRPSPQLNVFDAVSSPELAAVLTHLTVCLMHGNDDTAPWLNAESAALVARMQWAEILGDMLCALEPLRKLTHLRVVIHTTVHRGTSGRKGCSEAVVNATRSSVFDFTGTAAALVRPLPSLRFLSVATSGFLAEYHSKGFDGEWKAYERWYAAKAWRVAERHGANATGDETAVLVELHDSVAEAIIRREELVLSEADKALHIRDEY